MSAYYGQHGEDFLLEKIFKGKNKGYFVEIGCLDGIEYSNTYHFEKEGWKGACIEAHNDFIPALLKNRPDSSVVHCAVGEDNKESVTFYANKVGSLSTLDKSEEERWKKNYSGDFYGFEEQKVAMRTLTSIFDELKLTTIDFVSLDIEGYEVQALVGLDFSKYRPKVFVIEYKDEVHKGQVEAILFPNQYYFLSKVGVNLFYSLDLTDKKILLAPYRGVRLIKIDQNGKESVHEIELNTYSLLTQIKSILKKLGAKKILDFFQRK